MKLAVMQPYFMPYLGYFQLARSCDHFVFLDDVAFIKQGFINRNRILLDGQPFTFSLPVSNISSFRRINEHWFTGQFDTLFGQLRQAYRRAPFFAPVSALIETLCSDGELNVARKAAASVLSVFDYLGLPLAHSFASRFPAGEARNQRRVLDLCARFEADRYHNSPGGRALYDASAFQAEGVQLCFVEGRFQTYAQVGGGGFVPGLSIIDVLMHNPPERVRQMLDDYLLEEAR
ncbi:WbqC family protein [Stutzerimonas nitrititolerans]|uniref:WbqC family protein n=2 Tax=Stutzerimonas nitrititolerans TaxID=2482751 RepID=UPI00289EEE77|nr:WbqC family protein [Stutzerimonas nitrititolerans]